MKRFSLPDNTSKETIILLAKLQSTICDGLERCCPASKLPRECRLATQTRL